MTGDLAAITTIENPEKKNTEEFIQEIADTLEALMSE